MAADYRGQNTVVLDLTKVTPIFDYFVVTTGTSPRQMRAIADEVERVLSEEGSSRLGVEGYETSTWILQDYGDVVLHIFTPETRSVYDLEHLWADAPHVDWKNTVDAAEAESTSRRLA
ncbi:MAG: ribosome silencing factor [Planctomycetaceae bacterium]